MANLFIKCIKDSLVAAHIHFDSDIGPHQMRKIAASYCKVMIRRDPSLEGKMIERMGCDNR